MFSGGVFLHKYKHKNTIKFISIILAVILLITLTLKVDNRLRILIKNYTNSKAKILANLVINQTVYDYLNEKGLKYTDLMQINSAEDGVVTSGTSVSIPCKAIVKLLFETMVSFEGSTGEGPTFKVTCGFG